MNTSNISNTFRMIQLACENNVKAVETEKLAEGMLKEDSGIDYQVELYRMERDAFNGLNDEYGNYFKAVRKAAEK